MGKRKSRRKTIAKPQTRKLENEFDCLFCSAIKSVGVNIRRKEQVAILSCRECQIGYQTEIFPQAEAVDVYSIWRDSCEEVNSPPKHAVDGHSLPPGLDISPGRNLGFQVQQAKRFTVQPEKAMNAPPAKVTRKRPLNAQTAKPRLPKSKKKRTGKGSLDASEEEEDVGLSEEEDEEELPEEEEDEEEFDENLLSPDPDPTHTKHARQAAPPQHEIEVDDDFDHTVPQTEAAGGGARIRRLVGGWEDSDEEAHDTQEVD